MQFLCASSDYGFLISLRIALESEDIETYLSDADRATAGLTSAGNAGRLYLLNPDDMDSALRVMKSLEPESNADHPVPTVSSGKPLSAWLVPLAITAVILVISVLVAG